MKSNDVTDLTRAFSQKDAIGRYTARTSMLDFSEHDYRGYLCGLDISDEQASELMRIVWDIMRMWVEIDLPADTCGQIVENIINPIPDESDSLD